MLASYRLRHDVIAERVVALTRTDPPVEATHWTASMMAKAVGISASSVQRIWHAHGLQPHRVQQFKLSNDPKFALPAGVGAKTISKVLHLRHHRFLPVS